MKLEEFALSQRSKTKDKLNLKIYGRSFEKKTILEGIGPLKKFLPKLTTACAAMAAVWIRPWFKYSRHRTSNSSSTDEMKILKQSKEKSFANHNQYKINLGACSLPGFLPRTTNIASKPGYPNLFTSGPPMRRGKGKILI